MTTTLNKIIECSPRKEGWEKLLNTLGKTKADDEELSLLTILDSNGLDDALWCLRAVEGYDAELRGFARFCAMQNIEKIKPYCTEVNYSLLITWLGTGNEDLRSAAESAALAVAGSAARAAARAVAGSAAGSAARAAGSAARAAAWSVARSVAWSAAGSVWAVARSVAWSAAGSAARSIQEVELRRILSKETL